MTDLVDLVALSLLPPWYGLPAAERLRRGDSPGLILEDLADHAARDEPGKVSALRSKAAAAVARAAAAAMMPVTWSDPAYPVALTTIADPPPVLWVRGRVDVLSAPSVAIVGSRAASPYGLSVAAQLAGDLAARGLVIVSGLARGIDSAAHRGALAGAGVTVAYSGRASMSSIRRSMRRWSRTSRKRARLSASWCRARRRCRCSFRGATGSSAGCRAPSS